MKKLTMAWVLGLGGAVAMSAGAYEKTTGNKAGGATKHVTGCLEKGADATTYKLTHVTGGADWQLIGADESLKLSDHLGHKVEVSGTSLGRAPAGTSNLNSDDKGVSSGTGSGSKAVVAKTTSDDDKGVSSGTGSGAKGVKGETGARQLKVTSLKHVSPTCP